MNMKMKRAVPFVAMVVAQVTQVGVTIATKKAVETGMHNFCCTFYCNALASLILLPSAILANRSSNRPPLTFSVAGGIFVVGILGFMFQVIGIAGITYASATEATAILNLIPGFTFLLAIIFRLERLEYGALSTWAKIIGTLVTVVGALVVTFYAGPEIINSRLTSLLNPLQGQSSDWILGGIIVLVDCILAALFIVAQALILKKYPSVMILVLTYCSITAVLSFLASFILEHDLNEFSLQSKTRLFAILYSGVFGAGFQTTVGAWCVKIKGPHFVSMFLPLGIVVAAIMGVLFLGDGLSLGCVLGSVVIVTGFYGVMWGKSKEDKTGEANMIERAKLPLLQDNSEDDNV